MLRLTRAGWAALLASGSSFAAEGVRIMIDPGHGGIQSGAVGPDGVQEKALALEIARLTKAALQKRLSAKVILTRDQDALLHLSDRVTLANRQKPDLFISIHANSMPTKRQRSRVQGLETFFLSANASGEEAKRVAMRENAESKGSGSGKKPDPLAYILADLVRSEAHVDSSRLAYSVHQALIAATGATDRRVQQAPFYVLMGVEAPAILVEIGFISNTEECKRLESAEYQARIASAIAQGVSDFLSPRDGRQAQRASASSAPAATP
jgi:N-acetylmuramoyl-L-alanine amidase